MTSPVEEIRVECPRCATVFEDWTRGSLNRDIEEIDDDYVRQVSTATCPECGHVVALGTLVVKDGVWSVGRTPEQEERARSETDPAAAALFKLDPANDLLRPGTFRGTLWLQAVSWEIDRLNRTKN